MDLNETLKSIKADNAKCIDPKILEVENLNGKNLTILFHRNDQGGTVTKDLTEDLAKTDRHPYRRTGTAIMQTIDSLIAHVNRFKNPESALFAKKNIDQSGKMTLSIQAVLNYHDRLNLTALKSQSMGKSADPAAAPEMAQHDLAAPAMPQHGDHRATHTFPLSDELKAWLKVDGKGLDLLDFAFHLEDNILDVMALPAYLTPSGGDPETPADKRLKELITKLDGNPCGPEKLMALSKGGQINEDSKAKVFIDRNTGAQSIGFETEHQDAEGNELSIPNMFLIAIPIFEGGPLYRIPVRLRYRKKGGSVVWLIEPYQVERYIKDAFAEACERAAEETGLPLFFGDPE